MKIDSSISDYLFKAHLKADWANIYYFSCKDENGKYAISDKIVDYFKSRGMKEDHQIVTCSVPIHTKSNYTIHRPPFESEDQPFLQKLISLSMLTFSHELAFSVALEQIYRARCIIENHPYHHGEKSPLAKKLSF